mmetsp:Transcript_2988/g.8765  ORF Transcript_2988/g.8765 Transcript_2988/m.8765 type:complete len:151 (+) Transcript_2988:123-575(+)
MSAHKGNPASEPLLHSSHEGSGDPVIIWEGTTWQTCPFLLKCLTPAICSAWQWRVTTQRIDLTHGCCSSDEDTFDLRRIDDLHFQRSLLQRLFNRGTIIIHCSHDEMPELRLSTFSAKDIFEKLKEAWMRARVATTIGHAGDMEHHGYCY